MTFRIAHGTTLGAELKLALRLPIMLTGGLHSRCPILEYALKTTRRPILSSLGCSRARAFRRNVIWHTGRSLYGSTLASKTKSTKIHIMTTASITFLNIGDTCSPSAKIRVAATIRSLRQLFLCL